MDPESISSICLSENGIFQTAYMPAANDASSRIHGHANQIIRPVQLVTGAVHCNLPNTWQSHNFFLITSRQKKQIDQLSWVIIQGSLPSQLEIIPADFLFQYDAMALSQGRPVNNLQDCFQAWPGDWCCILDSWQPGQVAWLHTRFGGTQVVQARYIQMRIFQFEYGRWISLANTKAFLSPHSCAPNTGPGLLRAGTLHAAQGPKRTF